MSDFILETKDLTKIFGEHKASDNINIHVKKGVIYGLIGRNGAGKTTLMKMVTGLSNPTSGSFSINGHSGSELKKVRRLVGCHIEAPGLYPDMTAYQNLKCKCIQRGIKDKGHIEELLELVGLSNTGKKKAAKFSLGMKQRLGIAMALIGSPELLILDEPINGLDPQGIREIREILIKLNERGLTIIISSHILDELAKIATDYGIIHGGRLIEEVTSEELFSMCRDKVIIKTPDTQSCKTALEKMGIDDIDVNDGVIELSGHITETAAINRSLLDDGIEVSEIYVQAETLEDHYLKLTGGY
ncbi:MAG: ATP-binding cassette domain-containing protein [Ruminococcus sp.]|nr:ATP-binding cassette domain-containing protein [Ruminococcus sp.]